MPLTAEVVAARPSRSRLLGQSSARAPVGWIAGASFWTGQCDFFTILAPTTPPLVAHPRDYRVRPGVHRREPGARDTTVNHSTHPRRRRRRHRRFAIAIPAHRRLPVFLSLGIVVTASLLVGLVLARMS